jgi:hypothetical protein
MFMVYLQTNLHVNSLNGSLLIPIKPKAEYKFHEDATCFNSIKQNSL